MHDVRVLYDGGCPICRACVRRLRPDSSGTRFTLLDARADPGVVRSLAMQGFELDEGVVVETKAAHYCGADAARLLSRVHRASGMLERLAVWAFRSRRRAKHLYPVLRFCRGLALRALRLRPLGVRR